MPIAEAMLALVLAATAAWSSWRRRPPHWPHYLQQPLEVSVADDAAGEGGWKARRQQARPEAKGQLPHLAVRAGRAHLVRT